MRCDGCLAEQARKAGQIEEDGADKQDLHKFADRMHTVLRNPIDTSLLGKVRCPVMLLPPEHPPPLECACESLRGVCPISLASAIYASAVCRSCDPDGTGVMVCMAWLWAYLPVLDPGVACAVMTRCKHQALNSGQVIVWMMGPVTASFACRILWPRARHQAPQPLLSG